MLRGLGLEVEQRALLLMHDTADFAACFLGAMKVGAVPVPVNTLLTPTDYLHMLVDSRARVLVVSDALLPRVELALAGVTVRPRVVVARSPLGGDAGEHPRHGRGPRACTVAPHDCSSHVPRRLRVRVLVRTAIDRSIN